ANVERIDAGAGDDTVTGTSGADTIIGNAGNDVLNGGAGNDSFVIEGTGAGTDQFHGGDGQDALKGAEGWSGDTFRVESGLANLDSIESIDGGSATDTILAGSGNDTLDFGNMTIANVERIDAGSGNDIVTGSDGTDSIFGNAGSDTIYSSEGSDYLDGGADEDLFILQTATFASNDWVQHVEGGTGSDTVRLDGLGDDWVVTIDGQEIDTSESGSFDFNDNQAHTISIGDSTVVIDDVEKLEW
ncbi:MAG: hypothetical protein HZA67_06385, partial [Rhodospirillales bacterium]|nr:hypothetical protein [Rhodospirillales bacterium]